MVSLSTVYGVSIVLASLSAMGAAMVGTKVYPIQTGGDPLIAATGVGAAITGLFASASNMFSKEEPVPEPVPEPAPVPTAPPAPVPEVVPELSEEEKLKQLSPGSIV